MFRIALIAVLVGASATAFGQASDQPAERPPPSEPAPAPLDDAKIEAIVDARLAARPEPVVWKDGYFVESTKGYRLKVGGFIQFDGRFFVLDPVDPHVDQFIFRSIRPDFRGTFARYFDFRMFPDFAGGTLVIQDAYTDVHYFDAIELRVGKFKVPFGLERLQPETATTFVERGMPSQVAPNRDLGIELFGVIGGGIFQYQVGLFNGVADGQSGNGDVEDDKEVAARVFVRPFAQYGELVEELGFGGAVTYGEKDGTQANPEVPTYKTQGQTTFFQYVSGSSLANTVVADGRNWRVTAQGYWYVGRFGLFAEYAHSVQYVMLNGTHDRAPVDAWQVFGQWVISGERTSYRSVVPTRPFDPGKGDWGAFDFAARIAELRFTDTEIFKNGFADPTVSASRAWSGGVGADWFLNLNLRLFLDLEHTWYTLGAPTGDREPETSIIGRVQTVF